MYIYIHNLVTLSEYHICCKNLKPYVAYTYALIIFGINEPNACTYIHTIRTYVSTIVSCESTWNTFHYKVNTYVCIYHIPYISSCAVYIYIYLYTQGPV